MSGGIDISPGAAASIASIGIISVVTGNTSALTNLIPTIGPYRPAQWSKPAITMITVPPAYTQTTNASQANNAIGTSASGMYTATAGATAKPPTAAPQIYVFDAVMRVSHSQPLTITENPIQTGANMTDHAFLQAARVSMGIGMSDVMDAYAAGMWVGNASKSVSAFQVLDNLRASRIPLTVTTRLKTYTNMLIENIRADDTVKTLYGLSAVVEFKQIFIATVATQGVSARTQTTDSTNLGALQPTQPSAGITAQNQLPSTTTGAPTSSALESQVGTVNGAGTWSSNNTSSLSSEYA